MSEVKEKQYLKASDVASVFIHLSVVFTIFGLIGWGHFVQGKRDQARLRAESLGLQISAITLLHNANDQGSRGLASAERSFPSMGQDPWGQKYQIKLDPTNSRRLIVWSVGPNGKDETSSAISPEVLEVSFRGDDLGSFVSL